jgi:hypothetical protein
MHQSKMLVKLLGAVGAAILAVMMLAPLAQAREPATGYAQFAGCPSPEEVPTIATCFRSVVTGGHFLMGNKEVPIENPMTLSGGLTAEGAVVSSPQGGLTRAKQKVPGGVVGLTGLTWLLELFGVEALSLYATAELAGVPGNPLIQPIHLPLKVHLENPAGLIGNSCYVGSVAEPINLNLTTGTTSPPPPNEPITGKQPKVSFNRTTEIQTQKEGIFVDNSFAAPGASGCKLVLFGFIPISIDGLVDTQSGLPSPAGTNETVQNFEAEVVASKFVYP